MNTKILGDFGETAVAEYLCRQGWQILARQVRYVGAELDIVAKERDTIVFVEVKTRRNLTHGLPSQAVNFRKQRQIAKAAQSYLDRHNLWDKPCRFDVAEVYVQPSGSYDIKLITAAFEI